MKRLLVTAGALAAVAAALFVSTATATKESAHGRGTVIRVVERALTDATTDTGAAGDSAGDILTFANPIYDEADVGQVGTDQGYCVRVVAGTSYECTWTTSLDGGQIMVQGPFLDAGDSTLAVTGGTGAYEGARGSMQLHARPGGTSYDFVFHVR
jgi:allene oxide cyclase